MNFNHQMIESNHKLRDVNIRQGIQINQLESIMDQMYRRLQQYEPLPDLPGDKERRNRSEA